MNTLKPLVIFAVLVGVCYGVYSRINHKADSPPPEAVANWDSGVPSIQMGDNGQGPGGPSGFAPPAMALGMNPGGQASHAAHDANQALSDPRFGGSMPPQGGAESWNQPPNGNPGVVPPADYGAPPAGIPYDQQPPAGTGYEQTPAADNSYGTPPGQDYGGPSAGGQVSAFAAAFDQARRELDAGRLAEAHYQLSRWYDDPSLTSVEQQQLGELLDQLAGTVIYSTQNLMDPACEVQPGESLERIAQRYNVPWQLLAKINGIEDPQTLRPGERLKVIRGPFSAVVNLDKRVLTLMLNGAYAGRFNVGLGQEHLPQVGQYFVTEKVIDPTYYGPGRTVERGDPANPLGRRWIGLGNQMGLHGTNDPQNIGRNDLPGSVSLSDRDIDDIFDILSEGSKVTVRSDAAASGGVGVRSADAGGGAWRN